MRMNLAFILLAVLSFIFGLAFLLLPVQVAVLYNVPMDELALWMCRYFGFAVVTVGLVALAARRLHDLHDQRPFAVSFLAYSLLGLGVTVWMSLSPLGNALIWATAAIFALLVAAHVWALLPEGRSTASSASPPGRPAAMT
jgi:uncharacterized membrane protein YhaH (DUF805 family)